MNKAFALAAFIFTLTLSHFSLAQEDTNYYGSRNQEGTFSLISHTYFGKANGIPSETAIANDVKVKAKYILGYMRRQTENPSAIYPKYTLKTLKIESTSDNKYKVTYQMDAKGAFATGTSQYTFMIPIWHSTLLSKSQGKCTFADSSDVAESNFWYHWYPTLAGCPLIENVDYLRFTTQINLIENTKSTYPEYDRLIVNGTMNVSSFFGVAEYSETNWNPFTSSDIAARDYRQQRDSLIKNYKMSVRTWTESEIRQYYNPADGSPLPYIEDFTKVTPKGTVNFRLFFLNSGMEHDSRAFHLFLKPALASNQVVLYNGHSGIGKNLNLQMIESKRAFKMTINPAYQIIYMGSCVPYGYYTDMYFKSKMNPMDPNGTKNLDIIGFADESIFGNQYDERLIQALFYFMDRNQKQTYQTIIGNDARYKFQVSGDEDNPTKP